MSRACRLRSTRRWNDSFTPAIERLEERALLYGTWSEKTEAQGLSAQSADDISVAIGTDGRYVVSWVDGDRILYQRFEANGSPLSGIGQVEKLVLPMFTFYTDHQAPSVGMAADGSFNIAFQATKNNGTAVVGTEVWIARFASDGTERGLVQVSATGMQAVNPKIAVMDQGRFLVAWSQEGATGDADVAARVFWRNGDPTSSEFSVANSSEDEVLQDVAINPKDGEFVIVWASQTGTVNGNSNIYYAVYSSDLRKRWDASRVSDFQVGRQFEAAAAMNRLGDIFIVWTDNDQIRLLQVNEYRETSDELAHWRSSFSYAVSNIDVAAAADGSAMVIGFIEEYGGVKKALYRQYHESGGDMVRVETVASNVADISVAMNARNDYVFASNANDQANATYRWFQPRDAVGVFRDGMWHLDINNNGFFGDWDRSFRYGQAGDLPVAGDWNGDGFDEVGVFRDGVFYLDVNNSRSFSTGDLIYHFGLPGDIPLAIDWNGDGKDEFAVFRDGIWSVDVNGDGVWGDGDTSFLFGTSGDVPLIIDSENTGRPSVAVFRDGIWSVDRDRNGKWSASGDLAFEFGLRGDMPVAGNWLDPDQFRLTGDDDAAVFRKGVWSFDYDEVAGGGRRDGIIYFGLAGDLPVTGHWDTRIPPFSGGGIVVTSSSNTTLHSSGSFAQFSSLTRTPIFAEAVESDPNEVGNAVASPPSVTSILATGPNSAAMVAEATSQSYGVQVLIGSDEQSGKTVEDDDSDEEVVALLEREEDFEASAVEQAFAFELVEELLAI